MNTHESQAVTKVYGSIKPESIPVNLRGQTQTADFGLVRLAGTGGHPMGLAAKGQMPGAPGTAWPRSRGKKTPRGPLQSQGGGVAP